VHNRAKQGGSAPPKQFSFWHPLRHGRACCSGHASPRHRPQLADGHAPDVVSPRARHWRSDNAAASGMEEVLASHPGIAECAVLGIKDEQPCGFIVLKAHVARDAATIEKEITAHVEQ
jgi:hypothetical protein